MTDSERNDPPRGVQSMAWLRWILVGVMALIATLSVLYSFGFTPSTATTVSKTRYYCPMHPQVIQDQPGDCPICSMTLVPQANGGDGAAQKQVRPAAPQSHAGHRHEPSDPYICPMHPEETGPDVSARCPICRMKLEPRPPAKPPSAGVPGLVPVELSLDRVQLIGVRTAVASEAPLLSDMRVVGAVVADESKLARVHARFSGWLERLAVATTGQKVRAGQTLAAIYSPELLPAQQEFLAARRWKSSGTADKRFAAGALNPNFTAPLEQDARARLELLGMSRAEIDRVAESGEPTRTVAVTAPISGTVLRKTAVQGTYVEPGMELFEIADLSRVWIIADVSEADAARISVGQAAHVEVNNRPGPRIRGRVGFIYPVVETDTRTLRVRIELDNEDLGLRPGMYGNVWIELAKGQGVLIPSEAVVDTGEHQYVFLSREGGRFEPRSVRVGTRSGDKTQIVEGISAGDVVVTTANFLIDSESRLRAAIQAPGSEPTAQ